MGKQRDMNIRLNRAYGICSTLVRVLDHSQFSKTLAEATWNNLRIPKVEGILDFEAQ